jgi:Flp pilus assembly protein TadG
MPFTRRDSRGQRDRGAVAIETAFISVLLTTLLFGIVESSFLFKDGLAVSAAARAGARMGASQPRLANFAQLSADQVTNAVTGLTPASIEAVWVFKTTGVTGLPDSGSFASCTACVKFTWNPALKKLTTTSTAGWPASSQNACAGDPNRDALGVYVRYRHKSPLGLLFNGTIMKESTVMWIEPTAETICRPL